MAMKRVAINGLGREGRSILRQYAQGAFDEMTLVMTTDPDKITRWKNKVLNCAVNMKLTANNMIEVINTHYSELENWQYPPHIALRQGLQKVCQVEY